MIRPISDFISDDIKRRADAEFDAWKAAIKEFRCPRCGQVYHYSIKSSYPDFCFLCREKLEEADG